MWGIRDPGERPANEWKQHWFAYPFGVSERCKELDNWAAGKHLPGGQKPERLIVRRVDPPERDPTIQGL